VGDGEKPVEDHSCIASCECLRVFTLGVVFLLDENRKNNNAEVSTEPRSSRVAAIRNCVTVRETNGRTDGRTGSATRAAALCGAVIITAATDTLSTDS